MNRVTAHRSGLTSVGLEVVVPACLLHGPMRENYARDTNAKRYTTRHNRLGTTWLHTESADEPCYHAKQEGTQFSAPKNGPKKGPRFRSSRWTQIWGHLHALKRGRKRCTPTMGGHTLGGLKWSSKVAPIFWPSNEASLSNFQGECICMRQQESVQMVRRVKNAL